MDRVALVSELRRNRLVAVVRSQSAAEALSLAQAAAEGREAKLVLTGGETAAHVCRRLGIAMLRIIDQAEPSIPLTVTARNQWVVTKSGSFGAPRGVVLSCANLVANCRQINQHIPLDPNWVFFNPLPIFHVFGLTGGVLLPLLTGLKTFQYPSPLHVKQIPPLVKDSRAAVLFATDTFINQYARSAAPDAPAGAGRLRRRSDDRTWPAPWREGRPAAR